VKQTEVNSHKEWALKFDIEPSLDHKSNWPQHQRLRATIHWVRCGCYWCILIKAPLKIPPQYKLNSGMSIVVPLDEAQHKLGGHLVAHTPHCAHQVPYTRFTLPQRAPQRHLNNNQLCWLVYTAGKVPHLLKGHKPFMLLNCFIHYLVFSENQMLCTLHAKFWGRGLTELVKSKIQTILCRVTSLVYQTCLCMTLAHLVPSPTPHTSWILRLVKTCVNSTINNKFTGITISTETLQVVNGNYWALEWPKPCVNSVTCDSSTTSTTTTMPPKRQQQHNQL
jgi:hypothetical protein